jgi:asparagine synthase (glutamine-hydrolysing)
MCGIVAGLFAKPVDERALERAMDRLTHRGPDARGRWLSQDRAWALGHTRLSIIGLDNGAQPMAAADGAVQMVVNGEFYGYRDVRDRLRADGAIFKTDSDSEIALHLYLAKGVGAAQDLRGEFAVVIADRRNNTMIAIRDRFGIKPLFYAVHEGSVVFASEIKALLELGVPARWDREAAFQEAFLFRPHERTLFAGIHTVPPGHYVIAQHGEVRAYPYWDLNFPTQDELSKDTRSDAEIIAGFRDVLGDAVRERLVADVEVASYLSGGIDSCAVLGLAQEGLSRPIRAYTLTFEDAVYDESALAEQQAAHVGATYHPVPVTTADLAAHYDDAIWHSETMFLNGHGIAKYMLSRAVRDAGIKVVFTGEGADEMLGGYPPFRRDVLLYNSQGQDAATVDRLLQEMRASNEASRGLLTTDREAPSELGSITRRLGWAPSWIEIFSHVGLKTTALYRPEFLAGLEALDPYEMGLARLPIDDRVIGRDPLNQSLYLWSRVQLPNFILTFLSDRMEMAHSIEGRVPFLDHKVAEYAAGLPVHMKINGMREKHVLREAVRDVIVEPVYNREKHPFMTPPACDDEDDAMFELFGDSIASDALDDQPVFDPTAVRMLYAFAPDDTAEERLARDALFHRVLSATVLHKRFGMTL